MSREDSLWAALALALFAMALIVLVVSWPQHVSVPRESSFAKGIHVSISREWGV